MLTQLRFFTSAYEGRSNVLMNEVTLATAYFPLPPLPPKDITYKKFFAIWDTGATNTVITERVVQGCGLKPIGMARVYHPGGETKDANVYFVNIRLPNKVEVYQVKVTEGILRGQADVLIGMDIIGRGDFAVTNKGGKTVFSFRIPSIECIDFTRELSKQRTLRPAPKIGRNTLCPCGSGKKYKNCCLKKR